MATTGTTNTPARQPRLLEQVREALRLRHYSLRTEQAPEEVRHLLESGQDIRTVQELLGQGFPTPPITAVQR